MKNFSFTLFTFFCFIFYLEVSAGEKQSPTIADVSFNLIEPSSILKITLNDFKIDDRNPIKNLNIDISFLGLKPISLISMNYQEPPKISRSRISIKSKEKYESNGFFGKRFNTLSNKDRKILIKICPLLKDDKLVSKALETALASAQRKEIQEFFGQQERLHEIKNIGSFCSLQVSRVYVYDVQSHLKTLGYNPGPVDGQFGSKTEKAIVSYFKQKNLNWNGTITAFDFFEMRESISGPKPRMFHGKPGFFEYFAEDRKIKGKQASINQKLNNRKTINVFRPWQKKELGFEKYSLAWTGWGSEYSEKAVTLRAIKHFAAYLPENRKTFKYPGIEKFVTSKNWGSVQEEKYSGVDKVIKLNHPEYPAFIAEIADNEIKKYYADGVLFDYWHNQHEYGSGYDAATVDKAHLNIVKAVREKIGSNKIIMGNVNHHKEKATIPYLNGVFLELYKLRKYQNTQELYSKPEYSMIESILEYYQKNLQYPKLIALEGWRKGRTKAHSNSFNIRIAKTLTAMSVVIPENGYITFADNNQKDADTTHSFYDFYYFDIGKPVEQGQKLKSGVGIKRHQNGFVAYNITKKDFSFYVSDKKVVIPKYSGLFCKGIKRFDCLPIN